MNITITKNNRNNYKPNKNIAPAYSLLAHKSKGPRSLTDNSCPKSHKIAATETIILLFEEIF